MASFLSFFSILASLTVLFILVDPSLARKHNKISLQKICSKTDDHNLCMKLMKTNSNSQSLYADYRSLTEVAIDLAYTKAEDIHQDIKHLIDGTRNYELKHIYNSCSKNYLDVLQDLQKTKNLYRNSNYKKIEFQISNAVKEVRSCKDQVKRKENDSSNLNTRNRELILLCDIVRISAKYWNGDDN